MCLRQKTLRRRPLLSVQDGGNRVCSHGNSLSPLQEMLMSTAQFQSCIEACHACALTCDHCARACLNEANVNAMADCIALDIDCSEICRLAAACMARDSKMVSFICEACAEVCEHCQEECGKYQMDHCKACVESCRKCAELCRAIVTSGANIEQHSSPSAIVAGLRQ